VLLPGFGGERNHEGRRSSALIVSTVIAVMIGLLPTTSAYAGVAPVVTALTPNSGPTAGGTVVTITGTNLAATTAVTFDGTPATAITNISTTELKATTPAHPAGAVDVRITARAGVSPASEYTYVAIATFPPLPPPMANPSPNQEESAAELARIVVAGSPDSIPALLRGLEESAVPVLDGVTVRNVDPVSGQPVEAWEIPAIASLPSTSTPAADFIAELVEHEANIDPARLVAAFSYDVRAATQTTAPTPARFWAHFVSELGVAAGAPSILVTEDGLLRLTPLQMELIARKVTGELISASGRTPVIATEITSSTMQVAAAAAASTVPDSAGAVPCRLSNDADNIIGAAEVGISNLFNQLMDLAGLSGYGKAVGKAQVVLDALKIAHMYASVEGEWSSPGELSRTKSTTQPGDSATFGLRVTSNASKEEYVNCFRLAFAAIGLTLSVQPGGPISGGEVEWIGIGEGFGVGGTVQYNPPDGQTLSTPLNADGRASMGVEGQPQKQPILDNATQSVRKPARTTVCVKFKRNNLFSDAPGVVDDALGPLSIPFSLLERTCWVTLSRPFTVLDWENLDQLTGVLTSKEIADGNTERSTSHHELTVALDVNMLRTADGFEDNGTTYTLTWLVEDDRSEINQNCKYHLSSTVRGTATTPAFLETRPIRSGSHINIDVGMPGEETRTVSGVAPIDPQRPMSACATPGTTVNNAIFGVRECIPPPGQPNDPIGGFVGSSELTAEGNLFFDFTCTEVETLPGWIRTQTVSGHLDLVG